MPRARANQQHHHANSLPQAHLAHQAATMYQQQQQQQQQQQRNDLQVQRSQGVIFLSTNNKPQPQVAQPQLQVPSLPTHPQLAHQVNQMPAHHASMFQPQNVPAFVPTSLMQNPFFPYYQQIPSAIAQGTSTIALNDIYTPNGAGTYDTTMQLPPEPITKSKPKTRSRTMYEESDSSSDEFNDDDEDPDWNPIAGENEIQEPIFEQSRGRGGQRGRRTSTTPRGRGSRGGGGGRGRGRGRGRGGRGRVSDLAGPPPLVDQTSTSQYQNQSGGRQTRNSMSMPLLDPQTGQMSFGELVSQAVQSLNDPDDQYSAGRQKKRVGAIITAHTDKTVEVIRVPIDEPPSMFLKIPFHPVPAKKGKEDCDIVREEEDLILAYEIVQDEDRKRPFMCETCGEETRSRVLHNQHLITHNPSCRFACCICSQLFENHEHLKPHLRSHHGSGIFVCPEMDCEGVFSERKSLDDHDFACHPNARPFVCRFCLDRFATDALAKDHEEGHDEDITVTCMKCPETFTKKSDIKNHYSHMHEEKTCMYCSNKFENQPTLEAHLNEKHEEEMKPPPEPSPPPSPDAGPADDDLVHSPGGAGAAGDDDDIVVVEEHKKKTPAPSKPARKSEPATAKRPIPGPSKTSAKVGPKSKTKPLLPPTPLNRKAPTAPADDVIVLSSDDEDDKDPKWRPPEGLGLGRKSYPPTATRSSSRRKPEYKVVVETKTGAPLTDKLKKSTRSTNQTLTFVMNESGELEHVPGPGESHSKTLPIKEIMGIIKRKNLTDNTTIVIEGTKITSVTPSGASSKPTKSLLGTPTVSKKADPVMKLSKPLAGQSTQRAGPSSAIRKSEPNLTSRTLVSSSKPALVAKKRTGGLPRFDKNDRDGKSDISSTSSDKSKAKPAGPIAKKRTGGSSLLYDKMDSAVKPKSPEVVKYKHTPRKEKHKLRVHDDDDKDPLADDSGSDFIPMSKKRPSSKTTSSPRTSKSNKKSKKSSSKSSRREERNKKSIQLEPSPPASPMDPLGDYDNTPKRSLRIALKASVTDAPGEDSQPQEEFGGEETYEPVPKKRGRKSLEESNVGLASATAAANGQVVMKALVNGKWQDVVIGTKLNNDPEPIATTSKAPKPPPKKTVGGVKKTGPVIQQPRGNAGGRGKRGRKGKQPAVACWRDDRYQFTEGNRVVGSFDQSDDVYDPSVHIKEDSNVDYNQSYADDTMLPFSLSNHFMAYQQNMNEHLEEQEPEPDDQVPVIMNAYHLDTGVPNPVEEDNYQNNYTDNGIPTTHSNYEPAEIDEIPLQDPLAMDDGPPEDIGDNDPLADAQSEPSPAPAPIVEPKKGTVQEAKSAISNLRSVLSQITFKR